MKDVNEKKWRRFVSILDIITTTIAIVIADIIAVKWLDEGLVAKIIITVTIILIFTPVNRLIENAVYRNEKLHKKFE